MSDLEARYRRVLRLLPAGYREAWQEEMVAAFLDTMHSGDPERDEIVTAYARPSRSEVASVVSLAVRLRLGGSEAPPRSFLWGQAVRRVALTGLLVHAAVATVGVVQEVWVAGWLAWPPVPGAVRAMDMRAPNLGSVAAELAPALAWVGAYAALVWGRRAAAAVLAGLALAWSLTLVTVATVTHALGGPPASPFGLLLWADMLVTALVVLSLAAFHRDAPPVARRPWLVAYGAGVLVGGVAGVVFLLQAVHELAVLDWPGVWSLALIVAAVTQLSRPRGEPAWSLALTLLAAGVLGLRLVSLLDYALGDPSWMGGPTIAVGLAQAAGVAVAGAALAGGVTRPSGHEARPLAAGKSSRSGPGRR